MYDLKNGQVTISKDVICDESRSWNWEATSKEAQSRILLKEETSARLTISRDQTVRRSTRISQLPSHLRDYELFQESLVNSEGELVHFELIAKFESVEFEKIVTNEKWLNAMKEEINSIERESNLGAGRSSSAQEVYSTEMGLQGEG